jgi:hypothetical protein
MAPSDREAAELHRELARPDDLDGHPATLARRTANTKDSGTLASTVPVSAEVTP